MLRAGSGSFRGLSTRQSLVRLLGCDHGAHHRPVSPRWPWFSTSQDTDHTQWCQGGLSAMMVCEVRKEAWSFLRGSEARRTHWGPDALLEPLLRQLSLPQSKAGEGVGDRSHVLIGDSGALWGQGGLHANHL